MAFPDVMVGPEPPVQGYVIMDDRETGYWFDALGWVAYFFAQLEWGSCYVIEALGQPQSREAALKLPFKRRCLHAAALVKSHVGAGRLGAEWDEFWADAIAAAPMRNDILHNPFTLGIERREKVTDADGIKLMQRPGQPVVKLGRIQAYNNALAALVHQMHQLLSKTSFPT